MHKAFSLTHKIQLRRGFTLLELIAVMGIAVALSLVIVGGYSGIMRTMAEMAGVNALRRGATLARQHATIDGRETYFFITGFDSYVLCRRAGVISDRHTRSLTADERPPYARSSAASDAIWIYDKYSDLGAAAESFAGIDAEAGMDAEELNAFRTDYKGISLFDLNKGTFATVIYPPWFEHKTDRWIMGLSKTNALGAATQGFAANSHYGWTVYPEQKLPKGYAFVKTKDNFRDEGSFFFRPDGTAGTDDNMLTVSIQELSSGKISTIKIDRSGKIEADY